MAIIGIGKIMECSLFKNIQFPLPILGVNIRLDIKNAMTSIGKNVEAAN